MRNEIMMYKIDSRKCEDLKSTVENYLNESFKIKVGDFTENFIENQYTHFIFSDEYHGIFYFIVVKDQTSLDNLII